MTQTRLHHRIQSDHRMPSTVRWVTLRDVAQYINGRAFKPEEWGANGLPIIRIQNLSSADAPFNYFAGEVDDRHLVHNGDLLISWSGTLDAFIWNRGPAVLNQHIFKVVENRQVVRRDYLYYAVRYVMDEIRSHVHGATMQHITKGKFEAVRIPLPPLPVQADIAHVLAEGERVLAGGIEAAADAARAARHLPSALFDLAFRGMVPVSASTDEARAPAGWSWRLLTEAARLESGHTPSRRHPEWWGGDIPWIALPDIRALDGRIAFDTAEKINEEGIANSSARLLPKNTVVMCRDASVGYVTVMGRPMATSQHFVNWVCGPDLDPFFLAYALRASREYIRGLASGSVLPTVYMPTLKSLRVCAPPIGEQRRIVGELDAQFREVATTTRGLESRLRLVSSLPSAVLRSAFAKQESLELRRGAVASYLVQQLSDQPTFGRVMFQKLLYLTEAHLGVDLGGRYERRAAGPHAPRALREVEALAEENGWFSSRKEDGRYVYTPGPEVSERLAAATTLLGGRREELDRLIAIFGHRRTEIAEVVATLFAAWNDFLLDGHTPTDDEIVAELHTNWHERKRTFSADRLRQALDWMRDKNIVPVGRGPRTEMVNA